MRIGGDDRLDAALGELTRADVLACIMWIKRDPESARCQPSQGMKAMPASLQRSTSRSDDLSRRL